tara:strand:- start:110 stop:649 length:540 start_codon:yes stop_codon:yes gene_type:complete
MQINKKKDVEIFEDIISLEEQNKLEELLLSDNFPWFYTPDITFGEESIQKRPALAHMFIIKGELNSSYMYAIEPIIKGIQVALNYNQVSILRITSFLQFPLNLKSKKLDSPHTDTGVKHKALIYYVTDNEAHTVIFNKGSSIRIKPKKGRLAVFNGSLLHTAEQPTKNVRCIINFNITN